ncbi:MAG: rhomboid family intramembrane serine protease [Sphingobacteriaceae bacterium]|nr:MAG: rhomboid family intramembrane serine protease [Sphingobacteriaceae bacterium]
MNTLWQQIANKTFRSTSKLYLLIAINVAVFLIVNIPAVIELLFFSTHSILTYSSDYLAMPAYLPRLLTRFWTPVTYQFMHAGILHILFNMLWLFWMGQIFEEFLGTKRTIGLYLLGGLFGAAFFVISYNIFPFFTNSEAALYGSVVGASASVMAIIVAAATIVPNYTIPLMFLGPVKLKWLVLFYVAIDFLGVTGPNAGGQIAHLGGALFGFMYVKQIQKGNDWIGSITGLFKKRSKLKVVANNKDKSTITKPRQEEVDRILDKISKSGYENLTKQEKEILFRASNNES